ncbi:hypothetical protein AB1N83_013892 [Pleurotus pulmonarius]
MVVEKADDRAVYVIRNPLPGAPDTSINVAIIQGQHVCMIQDSKHALKTFRNNLFSGARLLTFGNNTATYQRILEVSLEGNSPLFARDVVRLDRQDDNAATRLFSSGFLNYLVNHHQEHCLGEIIYLFVFGELIDAYQNRQISHIERIYLALRAHYFLDSWIKFLERAGYKKTQFTISREAIDITRIIVEGLIGLVFIYRDHVSPVHPLLPWLHSTEPCEHTFGTARQIVKDFSMLDFYYMIPKLHIKHRQAILRARTSDPKAQASGYCHTYFDNTDVDLLSLAVFPDDHEINDAAIKASEEVNTLVALLGVERELLYRKDKSVMLPSIGAWYTGDSDIPKANIELTPGDLGDSDTLSASETDSDTDLEANELQALIEREESSTTIRSRAQENTLLSLACANFGLIADNMVQAYSTADGDEELHEELHAEEYQSIQLHSKTIAELRTSQASKPIGLGLLKVSEIHIDTLVDLRRRHETRQARLGLRTRDHRPATSPSDKEQVSARRAIIQRYHEVLRETEHAVPAGTGINRKVRTEGATITEILPTTGNAANAALAATVIQKKAANRRKEAFTKFLPKTSSLIAHLVTARLKAPDLNVSNGQPLDLGDYGIVMTAAGKLMVARIITFGSKSGGKHGRHDAISQTYNISALSRIGVQTYEHMHLRQFRSVHVSMQEWQTSTFALLGSINFLCRIAQPTTSPQWGVILSSEDTTLFKALQDSAGELAKALKWYNGRSKGETEDNDNEIDA